MSKASRVEQVALLALVYRELYAARYGARGGPEALTNDLESCPGETSLLLEIGSAALPEFDWTIVQALDRPETLPTLFRELAEFDSRRAEALAHAWPDDAPPAPLSLELLSRWEAVEEAMDGFRDLGLTASRDHVMALAYRAHRQSTGATLAETIDHYE